jgi:hypothetical protein
MSFFDQIKAKLQGLRRKAESAVDTVKDRFDGDLEPAGAESPAAESPAAESPAAESPVAAPPVAESPAAASPVEDAVDDDTN